MNIHVNTGTKWTAMAIAAAALVMSPFDGNGICHGCLLWDRISYPLFHASLLHALTNAWCLISIVFAYDLHWSRMAAAFAIAMALPDCLLSDTPVVGLSGVCFALMGLAMPHVRRKLLFAASVALLLALGIIMPGIAWKVHLFCYVIGLLVGDLLQALS